MDSNLPPTFPSLESTKLSSILNTIDSDVINQVQLDILSIIKTYRNDLTDQLNSVMNFEKTIGKKYIKVNDMLKKKIIENSELVSWRLNKKIDNFKFNHDDLDHYKNSNGICEINELCGDVMGKLMGIVDVLKEQNDALDIDVGEFPLLAKVLGIKKDFDLDSYDNIDEAEHESVKKEIEEIEKEIKDIEISHLKPQENINREVNENNDENIHEFNELDHNNDMNDEEGIYDPEIDLVLNKHLDIKDDLTTRSNSTEDPLASIERSISKYKSKQINQPGLILTNSTISNSTTTEIKNINIISNFEPSNKNIISENLKRFI